MERRRRGVVRVGATAVMLVAVLALTLVGGPSATAGEEPGAGLFRGHYVSKRTVVKNGELHRLVEGTRLRLEFRHESQKDVVGWSAGCNFFGGRVEITARRLQIGTIVQTEMGCPERLLRQDGWIAQFFGSDPEWRRCGPRLRLSSGDDVIKLRRRT